MKILCGIKIEEEIEEVGVKGLLLVLRKFLNANVVPQEKNQWERIFQTRCMVAENYAMLLSM